MSLKPNSQRLVPFAVLAAALSLAACGIGPSAEGTFDRSYDVNGPLRLELSEAAGSVKITGSAPGKIKIHARVKASSLFGSSKDTLAKVLSNPPVELRDNLLRLGKSNSGFRNTAIDYEIEIPHDTEINSNTASGSQNIQAVSGPLKIDAASGSVEVSKIDRSVQINTASGSITARDLNDDLRASSASGSITVANTRGDVRARSLAGKVTIDNPGARVETDSASGSVSIRGANNDVRSKTASGEISVVGNPSGNAYWELKTASGGVNIGVPPGSNFHLTAEAVSGEIRTDIPVVIEDQGKHSLRAKVGVPGGRVEVRTASGGIRLQPAS